MKSDQLLPLTTIHSGVIELLDKQIDIRRNVLSQLVGSLYPSIVSGEIADLIDLKAILKEKMK